MLTALRNDAVHAPARTLRPRPSALGRSASDSPASCFLLAPVSRAARSCLRAAPHNNMFLRQRLNAGVFFLETTSCKRS